MLLAIDIGNTNMVLGLYDNDVRKFSARISTDKEKTADEYTVILFQLFSIHDAQLSWVNDVIVSSVVPEVMRIVDRFIMQCFHKPPMIVGPGIKTGLNIRYDDPAQVGADRIINAVAGIEKYGAPLIIIDFGTATTFCAISQKKEYLGGAIIPGIHIANEALYQRASKLYKVELQQPKTVIGKNTTQSIQSGIIYGTIGTVNYMVDCMKEEMAFDDLTVIATGGYAELFSRITDAIDVVDQNLTLEGLRLIYERNREGKIND